MAGQKWLKGFLKRHPKITLKTAKNLSIACAMGVNEMVISNWFNLLQDIKNKSVFSPHAKYGLMMRLAYKTFQKK